MTISDQHPPPAFESWGAPLIYSRTETSGVQLLLGHAKGKSTVRNLGIEVDDARAIAGRVGI